ncbi:hypothetical protein ACFYZ9_33470 [Streptomyces sp. NPDC001691]|uniref:hypothetical protein n=1 Tax=Streptomyces sp. NPDC001691 TaxID=3364600 RepID=UPI0036CFB517
MVAPQQFLAPGDGAPETTKEAKKPQRPTPAPEDVAARVQHLCSLSKAKLRQALITFLLDSEKERDKRPEDYEVQALALRTPDVIRDARGLLAEIAREPEKFFPQPEDDGPKRYRNRLTALQSRAQTEGRLMYRVLAGDAARRGFFLPEFNARGRARRRLADENPVRFLELVREEEQAQKAKNDAERKRRAEERKMQKSAD